MALTPGRPEGEARLFDGRSASSYIVLGRGSAVAGREMVRWTLSTSLRTILQDHLFVLLDV